MNITEILDRYEALAHEILSLLQEERTCLKNGLPSDPLLERKRGLIAELGDAVGQVRVYRERRTEDVSPVSERLQFVQQRLMKILQLDREVEKLFLGISMRPALPDLAPVAARVGKAYQSAATSHA